MQGGSDLQVRNDDGWSVSGGRAVLSCDETAGFRDEFRAIALVVMSGGTQVGGICGDDLRQTIERAADSMKNRENRSCEASRCLFVVKSDDRHDARGAPGGEEAGKQRDADEDEDNSGEGWPVGDGDAEEETAQEPGEEER
jgi:hypothetical protein